MQAEIMTDGKMHPKNGRAPFDTKFNEYQGKGTTWGKLRVSAVVLSDTVWAENFLQVENEIKKVKLSHFEIDLRICRWADPIPMLCLVILATRLRALNVTVQVLFSLPIHYNSEHQQIQKDESNPRLSSNGCRFLSFLTNEGFIEAFLKAGVIIELRGNNRKVVVNSPQDVLSQVDSQELAYHGSTALKVDTICIEGELNDDVRRQISEQVSARLNHPTFQAQIQSHVENRFSEELISRLRVILIEGLNNIVEHAYEDKDAPKVGAFYVRFRKGLIGAEQSERQRLHAFIRAEANDSERLDVAFLTHQKGCLEVYVADNGVGITKTLEVRHPDIANRRYKFRYYIEQVLTRGISSNRDRRTARGALSLIHRNSSRYGDYLRIYSDQFWFGDNAPISTGSPASVHISKMVLRNREKTGPCGVYWHFRLGWQSSTDFDESWISIAKYPSAMVAAQAIYSAPLTDEERSIFGKVLVLRGREAFPKHDESEPIRHMARHPDTEVVVWFSGGQLLKNDILKRVSEASSFGPNNKFKRLYIVDIEPHDADLYLWALRDLKTDIRNDWPRAFEEIVLLTTTWKCCALDYRREQLRHGYEENTTKSKAFYETSFRPLRFSESKVCDLLAFFRWQASQQFWRLLSTEDQLNSVYFNGTVAWSEDPHQDINGYLDFGLASASTSAKAILAAELKRYCLLYADAVPVLYSFDSYVANIVDHVDWQLGSKSQNERRPRHGIGSVLVTGKTLGSYNAEEGRHVHFFAHPNAVQTLGKVRTLLFWPAGEHWFDSKVYRGGAEPKRRIGSTAAISAKGNKTFILPRWGEDGNPIALRAPEKTYKDFQELPPLIQAGHWSDGAHHDFITLNMRNAVNRSDIDGEGVFTYLATCIVQALGLRTELTEHGKSQLRDFKTRHNTHRKEFNTIACAVVYPMRGDAAHIVELFLERYIVAELRHTVAKRLIGIGNIRATGPRLPLLLSPSAQERIKAALEVKREGSGTLLFIDDAMITGKTHIEVISVLRALGAQNIVTSVGVDRRRLPSGRISHENVSSYWRLDVPPLGDTYSCPVCTARSSLGLLTSLLSSEQLIEHTETVINRWAAMDPNRDWDKALRPIPLNKTSLRYGLGEGTFNEVRHQVDIRSSTSLTTWYVELETMTGSEQAFDRAIKRISEASTQGGDDEKMAKLELLSSAVLFFATSLPPKRLLCIVEEIISLIIKNGSNGSRTSLGSLAIISTVDIVTQYEGNPFEAIIDRHFAQDVEGLSDDARMLITALIAKRAISVTHPKVLQLSRLLFGMPVPLAHRYNLFHAELISPIGNFHGRPLMKIIEGVNFSSDTGQAVIREAFASCDFLIKFIQTIPFDFAAATSTSHNAKDDNILEAVDGSLMRAKEALKLAYHDGGGLSELRNICSQLVFHLKSLRDHLSVNIKNIHSSIEALIKGAEDEWPANMSPPRNGVSISNQRKGSLRLLDGEDRWVVWDNQIRLMLKDILKNSLFHNNGPITNPFGAHSQNTSLTWLVWQLDEKDMLIHIGNSTKPEKSQTALDAKGVIRFRRLRDIGGDVTWEEKSDNYYITTIRLPYMGYCDSNQGKRSKS